MEIKTHAKLYWGDLVYRLISDKPITISERPDHDRYLVVPLQEYANQKHSYIRAIDVPRHEYAVEFTEELVIAVQEPEDDFPLGEPPEPEVPGVVTPTNEVILDKDMEK